MVDEKETRLREGMKMMGLQNLVFWASWLLTYAALFFVVCCIFIAMSSHYLFAYTNVEILFLLFFVFAINLLFLACLCTAFFSRAKTAGTLSPFVLLLAFLPFFAVNDKSKSAAAKLFASLLSPVAFSLASKTLVEYQSGFQGITWANINELHNNTSFAQMLLMMCLDTVIYAVLAWYLDNVLPSEFGTHESPLFCVRWQYWRDSCCCFGKSRDGDNEDDQVSDHHRPADSHPWDAVSAAATGAYRSVIDDADHALIEPVSSAVAARPGVHVRALRKQFTNDRGDAFLAVRGMDLDLHEGELCVLLGHNGAGKTTLINMLTGMCEPTDGRAWLYGREISADMSAIRRSLGVCPQHDVLFPTLSVREHLEFFLRLKDSSSSGESTSSAGSGLSSSGSSGSSASKSSAAIQRAVEAAAAEVQLEAKLDAAASTLSGGQRRRLSLAIAFIGDSKVIFLGTSKTECRGGGNE